MKPLTTKTTQSERRLGSFFGKNHLAPLMESKYKFREKETDNLHGGDFQIKGRKFVIQNKHGDEIELEIGDDFWITDVQTGRDGCNVFFLEQSHNNKDPYEWTPMLTVHLTHSEEMIAYAGENCWGNLDADTQRTMAECPVVEHFAQGCPRCRTC